MPAGDITEKSSQSNYQVARVRALAIDYDVDFDSKVLRGKCTYDVDILADNVTEVVLDTKDIEILGAKAAGESVPFVLESAVEPFGRALRIPITSSGKDSRVTVSCEWVTTSASTALQWLEPTQTSGSHPYLFSQNQAIHARSMIPCQDTPAVKATYTARVLAPSPLVAVMSAQRAPPAPGAPPAVQQEDMPDVPPGKTLYSFYQPVPIPSYLIALVVGQLESKQVGQRTRVWAEPSVLEAATWEFGEMERFVAAAEALVGPYVWGDYEVLVCPKSYPYGGMEHPVVTNITPTLLAGDRSLVDVIAHECAHSWTGNLVTNATWESFWLNEGFTMMLERKICAAVFGPGSYDFDAASGAFALGESIGTFMSRGQGEFTKLVPDLSGIDPDDAFSSVPYEKGFALLHALQTVVGVPPFEAFLHDYIQTYKFRTVTSEQFRAYTCAYFAEGRHALPRVSHVGVPPVHNGVTTGSPSAEDIAALSSAPNTGALDVPPAGVSEEEAAAARAHAIDVSSFPWDAWFYAPGQPPVANVYDRSQRQAVESLADAWVDGPTPTPGQGGSQAWPASHWMAFLERLSGRSSELASSTPRATFHPSLLSSLDSAYSFSTSKNAELRLHWYTLQIRSGVAECLPQVTDFLKSQGRMKYVRPLFRELLRTTFGRQAALALFDTCKSSYHPICAKMVAVDIEKEGGKEAVDPTTLVQVGGGPASSASSAAAAAEVVVVAAAAVAAAAPPAEPSAAEGSEERAAPGPADVPAVEQEKEEEGDDGEEEDEEEEDEEEDEDESSAPKRRSGGGFGVSVAKARERAGKKAMTRLGKYRPAQPVVQEEDVQEEEEAEAEEEEEEDGMEEVMTAGAAGAGVVGMSSMSTPSGKGRQQGVIPPTTPGLSSPAATLAEAEARLRAAEAKRAEMLARSPLKPMTPSERAAAGGQGAGQRALAEARRVAAEREIIKEDDLANSGIGSLASSMMGIPGTLVQESLESVQVSGGLATTLSTALAVAAVAAVGVGVVYMLRGNLRRL